MKLKEELEKDPQCKLKYKKYKRAWGYVNDETTIGSWYFHRPTSIETGTLDEIKIHWVPLSTSKNAKETARCNPTF